MRWKDGRRSDNIEDIRDQGPAGPRMAGAGPLILLRIVPFLLRTRGGRVLLLIGVVLFFGAKLLGIDPFALLQPPATTPQGQATARQPDAHEQELADFVSVTLADTEDTWQAAFTAMGKQYENPRLVLFRGRVNSACGSADSAVGPFYCGADGKVYIDLSFYDQLRSQLGAPGDFAQAYVIAHEVGHHVQNLLGISAKVEAARRGANEAQGNALSVRQELQADCFAGFWGHQANAQRAILDPGDLEEALTAASAIGDDRLQREARGTVVPDSFTHGTSEQRVRWFRRGFESGELSQCDTFAAQQL